MSRAIIHKLIKQLFEVRLQTVGMVLAVLTLFFGMAPEAKAAE